MARQRSRDPRCTKAGCDGDRSLRITEWTAAADRAIISGARARGVMMRAYEPTVAYTCTRCGTDYTHSVSWRWKPDPEWTADPARAGVNPDCYRCGPLFIQIYSWDRSASVAGYVCHGCDHEYRHRVPAGWTPPPGWLPAAA